MTAKLFCKTGQLAGASFEIKGEATIGKNAENSIQLYPGLISGKHARIFYDEQAKSYFLEDLNSRNGTRLDSVRVRGKERLGKLNVITFANTFDFLFQRTDVEQEATQPKVLPVKQQASVAKPKPASSSRPKAGEPKTQFSQGFTPPPKLEPDADTKQKTVYDDAAFVLPPIKEESSEESAKASTPSDTQRTKIGVDFTPVPSFVESSRPPKPPEPKSWSAPSYVLIFETLKGGPKVFDIKEGSTIVGREGSCTISVDDGSMSRKHAEFVLRGNTLTLKDLGSKNHTFIDNQRISTEVEVREGVEIGFGLIKARLVRKPKG